MGFSDQRSRDWIKLGFRRVLDGGAPQQCVFATEMVAWRIRCLLDLRKMWLPVWLLCSPAACSVVLHFNGTGQEEDFVWEGQCLGPGAIHLFLYLILKTSFLREAEKEQIWLNRSNLFSKARLNFLKETRRG